MAGQQGQARASFLRYEPVVVNPACFPAPRTLAVAGSLASLPGCPCQYPSNIFYDDKIWDVKRTRYFRWRDASGDSQRLDVYKPGAAYCVLSLLTQGSGSAAAQHCCYDRRRKLLTRGSGAGTPNFVSPEISPVLHERIDVLPWRLCKGDFSRSFSVPSILFTL